MVVLVHFLFLLAFFSIPIFFLYLMDVRPASEDDVRRRVSSFFFFHQRE